MSAGLVLVVGPHRTGTSVLARGLATLGVSLGEALLPADYGNEHGFWEDAEINALNVALLAKGGHDWDTPAPLDPDLLTAASASDLGDRARALIARRLERYPSFGAKDPRLCLVLPFWQAILREMGVDPRYVIATRNPVSAAQSLAVRDNMILPKALAVWLHHAAAALKHTEGLNRVVVDYDRMMDDPARELERMAKALDRPFDLNVRGRVNWFARQDLAPSLRHARFTTTEVSGARWPELAGVHDLMQGLARDEAPAPGRADAVASAFAWLEGHRTELAALHDADRTSRSLAAMLVPPAPAEPGLQPPPLPGPMPTPSLASSSAPSGRRTRVAVVVHAWIASLVIGVLVPLVHLRRQGRVDVRLVDRSRFRRARAAIEWADVVVFNRSNERPDLKLLYAAKAAGKRVIYEIDDNLNEISLNTAEGRFQRRFDRLFHMQLFMELSDLVRVYSPRMLEQARAFGAETRLAPTYFDRGLSARPQSAPRARQRGSAEPVARIAYPSGRHDEPRLERMFYEALRRVLLAYEGRVELHLWRPCPPSLLGLKGVVVHPPVPNYMAFQRRFLAMDFDIGLAPLLDEPFYASKTNLKYRDLGSAGVAGLYSDCPPYSDSVVHGRTGLLVENSVEAWYAAVSRLIEDPQLRRSIATEAGKDVGANYTLERAVAAWDEALEAVRRHPPRPCPWLYSPKVELNALVVESRSPRPGLVDGEPVDRIDMFHKAAAAAGGSADVLAPEAYASAAWDGGRDANLLLALVNTGEDLKAAVALLARCNSMALDISRLDMPVNAFAAALKGEWGNPALSIIALDPAADDLRGARSERYLHAVRDLGIPVHLIRSPARVEEIEFSRASYPAIYLGVIERHMRFGRKVRRRKHRWSFRPRPERIAAWLARRLDRTGHRLRLLAWRFGLPLM